MSIYRTIGPTLVCDMISKREFYVHVSLYTAKRPRGHYLRQVGTASVTFRQRKIKELMSRKRRIKTDDVLK